MGDEIQGIIYGERKGNRGGSGVPDHIAVQCGRNLLDCPARWTVQ